MRRARLLGETAEAGLADGAWSRNREARTCYGCALSFHICAPRS